ncbi:hypothetical protein MKX03_023341 [Papaver bracteatum]|nr:hypothetical protein MKX03_023341 [Papaver bracteatum]
MNLPGEGKSNESMGLHWHLLVSDIGDYQWEHYNSIKKGEIGERCSTNARIMETYCKPHIDKWLVKHGQPRGKDLSIEQMKVPDQGAHPDCLLNTCYWIKRSCKPLVLKSQHLVLKNEMIKKMQQWRYRMACKLLDDKKDGVSWGETTNEEFLNNRLIEDGCID